MLKPPARYSTHSSSLRWRVEIIVGRVGAFALRVFVCFIARVVPRFAAVGVHALYGRYLSQRAFTSMAHDVDQQPRDRIRIERVHMRRGFARDLAGVF